MDNMLSGMNKTIHLQKTGFTSLSTCLEKKSVLSHEASFVTESTGWTFPSILTRK